MITKKWFYATMAAFAIMFVLDYVWFQVIFKGYVESQMASTGNNVPMHALGEWCMAALLAWIYPIGYKGGSAMQEGMKFGILMGLLYGLPNAIHMYASMTGPVSMLAFFTAHGVVLAMVGGMAVAWVHGKRALA